MFTRTKTARELPPQDPYQAAKREFDSVVGEPVKQRNQWRLIAIIVSVVALVATGALGYASLQSKYIPYVVQVDKFGNVAYAGVANTAPSYSKELQGAFIGRFVTDWRSVTPDATQQKAMIGRVFGLIGNNTTGQQKLNEWFAINDPFKRGTLGGVSIDIRTKLPMSNNLWRVEWVETARDQTGKIIGVENWSASLTVAISVPNNEDEAARNPLGLFVTDANWTKETVQ
jgi:type IV secretion system protein VirB5